MNTLVAIAEAAPQLPRTFRAFRTVDEAVSLAIRVPESTVRIVNYGHGVVRAVVNYIGSNPRHRVRCAKERRIMLNGVTVNRLLPVTV